ncbi:Rieske 2Fe-2S domain-containing protein [Candidatus Spongiihabitans sp.]|uniref:Rieske 2Fe-2S domain-containing protein n=1 Tax=Candidatus Spongiihabitans sp. TaxID=3101308 RepID=UPI003C7AF330
MSHKFVLVNWNQRKRAYDICLWIGIALYLSLFVLVSHSRFQGEHAISALIILIRAFSTCGFIMLTLILCIGPLARIDGRFLPLLYNRRHFGVSFFIIVLIHAALAIFWYHSFGDINPIVSVVTSGGDYQSFDDFPFQLFGLLALLIFFVLAATSHDYWNAVLGPVWKTLHILVYPGYALLIVHIGFGAMQEDNTGLLPGMVFASVILVGGLHVYSALFCTRANKMIDRASIDSGSANDAKWVEVGKWQEIENDRAITVRVGDDERVAIFRYDENKLCAVSNVCQHQNGPLGEGKVIDGCITCPWHGYQYRPQDGCSPPPFTEKIATYRLQLRGDVISLNPQPLPAGTARPVTEIPRIPLAGN